MKELGIGGVAPLILRPRHSMEVSCQLHAPAALLPFYRGLGGLQSRYGRGGEEKYSQPPPGVES
jgi:hypothetical protein